MKFYKLEHIRYYQNNDFSDQKIIGIYSSKELAEKKQIEYEKKEGFKKHKKGFSIQELKLDNIRDENTLSKKNFYWILQVIEVFSDNYHEFIKTIGIFSKKEKAIEASQKVKNS